MIIEDLKISLQRKYIKNINLRLSQQGEIRVTAPHRVPEEVIRHFVLSKLDWIRKRIQSKSSMHTDISAEQEASLTVHIQDYMNYWQNVLGLSSIKWSLRKTRTRWGSYSLRTKRINFSTALAFKSKQCIEYVVLHELAHVFVPNHGAEFKRILDMHMPGWKVIQKDLRQ